MKNKKQIFSLKNSALKNAPWLTIILLLLFSFFLIKPIIAAYKETNIYNQTLNLQITDSGEEPIILENTGILNSLKITGQLTKEGEAKVYLKNDNENYLILDSTIIDNTILKTNNSILNQ